MWDSQGVGGLREGGAGREGRERVAVGPHASPTAKVTVLLSRISMLVQVQYERFPKSVLYSQVHSICARPTRRRLPGRPLPPALVGRMRFFQCGAPSFDRPSPSSSLIRFGSWFLDRSETDVERPADPAGAASVGRAGGVGALERSLRTSIWNHLRSPTAVTPASLRSSSLSSARTSSSLSRWNAAWSSTWARRRSPSCCRRRLQT